MRARPLAAATDSPAAAAAAGALAPPGIIVPSASVTQAMGLAVPITEQVPTVGTS